MKTEKRRKSALFVAYESTAEHLRITVRAAIELGAQPAKCLQIKSIGFPASMEHLQEKEGGSIGEQEAMTRKRLNQAICRLGVAAQANAYGCWG